MDATIMKYIPKAKKAAVQDCWKEESLGYATKCSYWIQLKEGWHFSNLDEGARICSEDRIIDLRYQIKGIEPYAG